MNSMQPEPFEEQLRRAAADLRYPPVPPLAPLVMRRVPQRGRPWAWAAAALVVVLLAVLLLASPARAGLLEFIQVGVVRIFRNPPAPVASATPGLKAPLTATPVASAQPSATPISPLRDLAGELTVAEARSQARFPILLPHYPSGLGAPDRVYLQDLGGQLLLLVWLEPDGSGHIRMSLQEIAPGSWAVDKYNPQVLQQVTVNGHAGAWVTGPYLLETRSQSFDQRRLVTGNTLVWTQGDITYRLESGLSLEEALKVAAS